MNEHVQTATTAPLFNPLSPDFIRDPYPHYQRMRNLDPVHQTPLGMFVASRHADISQVLRDKRELFDTIFSDRQTPRSLGLSHQEIFGLFKLNCPTGTIDLDEPLVPPGEAA